MNRKVSKFIKNFSYTLTSNLVSLVISTLVTLVVPKLIGINEYGYWQLYLFYSSYVGFLHFGWNDGIYLRYGGKKFKELDKKVFFSQFHMLLMMQAIIAVVIFVVINFVSIDDNKRFIFQMAAGCMIIVNARNMLLYILQGTNRIKEYAHITMLDRILYCCLIVMFLVFGIRDYKVMLAADLIGKLISLFYAMYCCSDIVFCKISTFYFNFRETISNISVGIKLMFSNIASTLIIGVVRFGIEKSWDVATFGKVSLTLSISNLMMLFINAIGLIMFPVLRRTDESKLPQIYIIMRDFLMVIMLAVLIIYYPLKVVLSMWLPGYTESIAFMALIFPMCIYEGKMALLINTYLKTLREEKAMLKINLITFSLSFLITLFTTIVQKNLVLAVVSIVITLAFRCMIAELYLAKKLGISLYKDIILESMITFIFIITGWFLNSWLIVILYALAYFAYLMMKKKDIKNSLNGMKLLMKV